MEESEIATKVVNCIFRMHQDLGPGLLESAYEECLFFELKDAGLHVSRQKPLPLEYGNIKMDIGYRVDLIVENRVVIDVKAVEALNDVHKAQVITYLKLTGFKLGILVNFNVALIKNGVKRVVNNL